jgi:alcohol oxidase
LFHAHDPFIRSGIGASEVLKKNDICQIVDLPGVGEHYMGKIQCSFLSNICTEHVLDHILAASPYFASEDADSLDTLFHGDETELERMSTVLFIYI